MTNTDAAKPRVLEILLVEDNRGDTLLTQKVLGGMKLANHITIAEDGDKALAILRREEKYAALPMPDIVLLDLNMPKKSGKEVLQEIKGDERLKHIPVIILTSSHAETDIAKTYDLHANGYIVKPVNPEKFMDMIRTLAWNRNIQLRI